MAVKIGSAEETTVPMYTVSFEWREYYEKGEGINSISVNVRAENNFQALIVAWDLIKPLALPEPSKFNAQRKEKC